MSQFNNILMFTIMTDDTNTVFSNIIRDFLINKEEICKSKINIDIIKELFIQKHRKQILRLGSLLFCLILTQHLYMFDYTSEFVRLR